MYVFTTNVYIFYLFFWYSSLQYGDFDILMFNVGAARISSIVAKSLWMSMNRVSVGFAFSVSKTFSLRVSLKVGT